MVPSCWRILYIAVIVSRVEIRWRPADHFGKYDKLLAIVNKRKFGHVVRAT